jgi:hypothetical protein
MNIDKIKIDSKYIKVSGSVIKEFRNYQKSDDEGSKKFDFFMVGNILEAHFDSGHIIKLGDIDWRPKYSL